MKNSIYKNKEVKEKILKLYDEKLASLEVEHESVYVDTFAGKTHVVILGNRSLPPVVVLHGINAGAPIAMEPVKNLKDKYCMYFIDTIGQATRSAETVLPINDNSYGSWLSETTEKLGITRAVFVGISYGGFILQKLMMHKPEMIKAVIFIVPAGIVNGPIWKSLQQISFPLIKFMVTKSDKHYHQFLDSLLTTKDDYFVKLQKHILLGVKVDFRRPKLLTKNNVEHFDKPVYIIGAENDLFFPGKQIIEKSKKLFKQVAGEHLIKGGKHIPDFSVYSEIEKVVDQWLSKEINK
jgi:pimeloyl-ACP methyl ester carboxylesterase